MVLALERTVSSGGCIPSCLCGDSTHCGHHNNQGRQRPTRVSELCGLCRSVPPSQTCSEPSARVESRLRSSPAWCSRALHERVETRMGRGTNQGLTWWPSFGNGIPGLGQALIDLDSSFECLECRCDLSGACSDVRFGRARDRFGSHRN